MRRRSQVGIFGVALLGVLLFSSNSYAEEALEAAPNKDVVKKVEEQAGVLEFDIPYVCVRWN